MGWYGHDRGRVWPYGPNHEIMGITDTNLGGISSAATQATFVAVPTQNTTIMTVSAGTATNVAVCGRTANTTKISICTTHNFMVGAIRPHTAMAVAVPTNNTHFFLFWRFSCDSFFPFLCLHSFLCFCAIFLSFFLFCHLFSFPFFRSFCSFFVLFLSHFVSPFYHFKCPFFGSILGHFVPYIFRFHALFFFFFSCQTFFMRQFCLLKIVKGKNCLLKM